MNIRTAGLAESTIIARLISGANRDVAVKFGLTVENCPKHPSFCTADWVKADFSRGEQYFILEQDTNPIGCVAYEKPSMGLAYLNRLSVLPMHRNLGAGSQLVRYIIDLARSECIQTISIGVIGENVALQRWYNSIGFISGETKRFPHLPFSVTYMSYTCDKCSLNT